MKAQFRFPACALAFPAAPGGPASRAGGRRRAGVAPDDDARGGTETDDLRRRVRQARQSHPQREVYLLDLRFQRRQGPKRWKRARREARPRQAGGAHRQPSRVARGARRRGAAWGRPRGRDPRRRGAHARAGLAPPGAGRNGEARAEGAQGLRNPGRARPGRMEVAPPGCRRGGLRPARCSRAGRAGHHSGGARERDGRDRAGRGGDGGPRAVREPGPAGARMGWTPSASSSHPRRTGR